MTKRYWFDVKIGVDASTRTTATKRLKKELDKIELWYINDRECKL